MQDFKKWWLYWMVLFMTLRQFFFRTRPFLPSFSVLVRHVRGKFRIYMSIYCHMTIYCHIAIYPNILLYYECVILIGKYPLVRRVGAASYSTQFTQMARYEHPQTERSLPVVPDFDQVVESRNQPNSK